MAIIYSYPKVTSPLATDVLVLTDTTLTAGKRKNKTKSLAMSDLAAYVVSSTSAITGSGTINTIPMFTPTGVKIGDSIITQAASGQGVTVTGQLDVTQDFNVTGSTELFSTLEVQGASTFSNVSFQRVVFDGGGNPGTAGQVLSSTGTGVEWINSTDANTTYNLFGATSNVNEYAIALSGSDGSLNKVNLVPGSNITLTSSATGVTIDAAGVTSIALTMPSAFSVAGSPITSSGTLAVTGAGLASQVILGDGTLGSIPGGPFLPLAGGTMTGNTLHGDNVKSTYGTIPTLEIYSDGITSFIKEVSAAGGNNLNIGGTLGVTLSGAGRTLFTGGGGVNTSIFDTNGVSRLELTTSDSIFPAGNVGIGTTNPADELHVQGTIRAVVPTASGTAFNAINSNAGTSSGIRFDNDHAGLVLKNSANVSSVKISANGFSHFVGGRVGIGTISPASRLHVNSGTANEVAKFESTDGTAYLSIMDSNTTNSLQGIGSAGDELTFYSNNAERMRIDSTGNVGIGTTSPDYHLQVESSGNAAMQVQRLGGAGILISGASTAGIVGTSNDYRLDLKTNNITRATISTSGNFGINSANPASKLTVRFGDIEVDAFQGASGLILSSPDGTRYRVTVANGGTLSVAAV